MSESQSSSFPSSSNFEDEEAEELEPREVVEQLTEAWQNESLSPDLLRHKFHLVDCGLDQINNMEHNLKLSKAAGRNEKDPVRFYAHKMEIERIRYVITSYVRKRIEKIEKYVFHYLKDHENSKQMQEEGRMSPEEKEYAQEYSQLIRTHFHNSVLAHLPSGSDVQNIDLDKYAPPPDLEHFVFVRANRPCDDVTVSDAAGQVREDVLQLAAGSQRLLPFKSVSELLQNGAVSLI